MLIAAATRNPTSHPFLYKALPALTWSFGLSSIDGVMRFRPYGLFSRVQWEHRQHCEVLPHIFSVEEGMEETWMMKEPGWKR